MQARVANYLHMVVESIPSFSVVVFQGYDLHIDLYVLSLHGVDVVLGVLWLATLVPVVTDYGACICEFSLNGSLVRWVGDTPTELQRVQFHSL